jgi:hypothetical protein
MAGEIRAWEKHRNDANVGLNLRFTTADAHVRLRHLYPQHEDGRSSTGWKGPRRPLCTNSKDTRTGKLDATELFKDLKVQAIDVKKVGK